MVLTIQLPEFFALLSTIHAEYRTALQRQQNGNAAAEQALSASTLAGAKDLSASRLRYDAYALPSVVQVKPKDREKKGVAPERRPFSAGRGPLSGQQEGEEGESMALLFDNEEVGLILPLTDR